MSGIYMHIPQISSTQYCFSTICWEHIHTHVQELEQKKHAQTQDKVKKTWQAENVIHKQPKFEDKVVRQNRAEVFKMVIQRQSLKTDRV